VRGLTPPAVGAPVELPRQGRLVWPQAQPQGIVVRYTSPEGWRAYSPPLSLSPPAADGVTRLRWPREAAR
jgi:hypothetical protein